MLLSYYSLFSRISLTFKSARLLIHSLFWQTRLKRLKNIFDVDDKTGFCMKLKQAFENDDFEFKDGKRFAAKVLADPWFRTLSLSAQEADAIRIAFVRPFTIPALKANGPLRGVIARFLTWWLDRLPPKHDLVMKADLIDIIVKNKLFAKPTSKKYCSFAAKLEGRKKGKKADSEEEASMDTLIQALKGAADGRDCDSLYALVDLVMGTLGSKWLPVGDTEPTTGRNLEHENLAEALRSKAEFTKQEWEAFGIKDLRTDHFIKSGDSYFQPAVCSDGFNEGMLLRAFDKSPGSLSCTVHLFFNPLLVEQDECESRFLGKDRVENDSGRDIKVKWSDSRLDKVQQGEVIDRFRTRDIAQKIVWRLLDSRSGSTSSLLRKIGDCIDELQNVISHRDERAKCSLLADRAMDLARWLCLSPADAHRVHLSRRVVELALSTRVRMDQKSTIPVHMDLDKQDILLKQLFDLAFLAPEWWGAIEKIADGGDESASNCERLALADYVRGYIREMSPQVRGNVLKYSLAEASRQDLSLDSLSTALQLLLDLIDIIEEHANVDPLFLQPRQFWESMTVRLTRGRDDKLDIVLSKLCNRTKVNVLAIILSKISTYSSNDAESRKLLLVCSRMAASDNLRMLWSRGVDSHEHYIRDIISSLHISLSALDGDDKSLHMDWIRTSIAMLSNLRLTQVAGDPEHLSEIVGCMQKVITKARRDIDPEDMKKVMLVLFGVVKACPAEQAAAYTQTKQVVASLMSSSCDLVLSARLEHSEFSQVLDLLHTSEETLKSFICALFCRLCAIDQEHVAFDTTCTHLKSLEMALETSELAHGIEDIVSAFIPELFDALMSPFRHHVARILAKVLNFSVNDLESLTSSLIAIKNQDPSGDEQRIDVAGAFYSASESTSNLRPSVPVTGNDFKKYAEILHDTSLTELDLTTKLAKVRRSKSLSERTPSKLILTPQTKANLEMIVEVVTDPIPLLLEGETGVGKSATIHEAANLTDNTLFRFNMSSRVTIEDLLGKIELSSNGEMKFRKQPFTEAFETGRWLLLDEVNLAADQVLQRIESALDSGKLVMSNPSNAADPTFIIKQHPNFRLFATQNPNTGFFRGRREELSDSFLSRFRKIQFSKLAPSDWKLVADKKLAEAISQDKEEDQCFSSSFLKDVCDKLCSYHNAVSRTTGAASFSERASYAEITIRELLKCIDHVAWLATNNHLQERNRDSASEWLSLVCSHVYCDRFRSKGSDDIFKEIKREGLPQKHDPDLTLTSRVEHDGGNCGELIKLSIGNLSVKLKVDSADDVRAVYLADYKAASVNRDLLHTVSRVHAEVSKLMLTTPFISDYGLYEIGIDWMEEAITFTLQHDSTPRYRSIALSYGARVRNEEAQKRVLAVVLSACDFKSDDIPSESREILLSLTPEARRGFSELPVAGWAFAITPNILWVWQRVMLACHLQSPILLTGGEACGKSAAIVSFARMQQLIVKQVCLTPETDPSTLVGQDCPVEGGSQEGRSMIEWQDGVITSAIKNKAWVLLDNFNHGEASVLERLNPVLESPAEWVLTEKGETQPMPIDPGFRILATMTPPRRTADSAELSPALYNRFNIIHYPDSWYSLQGSPCYGNFRTEFLKIVNTNTDLSDANCEDMCKLCWEILEFGRKRKVALTLRSLVRLVNSSYLFRMKHPNLDLRSSIWVSYLVTLKGQQLSVDDELSQVVRDHLESWQGQFPSMLEGLGFLVTKLESEMTEGDLVLTPRLKEQAAAIIGCIQCRMPVLLEGPAAVGKTALIEFLCRREDKALLRVNNSASTTLQDYLGSYLPSGKGSFQFMEGSLVKAMRLGLWFLADEFNLAEPAVMSILYPLLEGQGCISIPGTDDKIIHAHRDFRFFATQNHAKGYAGRFELPLSLRNRMLEVQIRDFDAKELGSILDGRAKSKGCRLSHEESKKIVEIYQKLRTSSSVNITLRDIVKWMQRKSCFAGDAPWGKVGLSLYDSRLQAVRACGGESDPIADAFKQVYKDLNAFEGTAIISQDGDACTFKLQMLSIKFDNFKLDRSDLWKDGQKPPQVFQRALVSVAFAVKAKEPVLLVGPSCYKSLLARTWAEISGLKDELKIVYMLPDSDTCEVIGQIQPFSFADLVTMMISIVCIVTQRIAKSCNAKSLNGKALSNSEAEDLIALRKVVEPGLKLRLEQFLAQVQAGVQSSTDSPVDEDKMPEKGDAWWANLQQASDHESCEAQSEASSDSENVYRDESSGSDDENILQDARDADAHTQGQRSRYSSSGSDDDELVPPTTKQTRGSSSSSGSDDDELLPDSATNRTANPAASCESDSGSDDEDLLAAIGVDSDDDDELNVRLHIDQMSPKATLIDEAVAREAAAPKEKSSPPPSDSKALPYGEKVNWGRKKENKSHTQEQPPLGGGVSKDDEDRSANLSHELSEQDISGQLEEDVQEEKEEEKDDWFNIFLDKSDSRMNEHLQIPQDVREYMQTLQDILKRQACAWLQEDSALSSEAERLNRVWQLIRDTASSGTQGDRPVFLFRDGPVPLAVKNGHLLMLEDFDLPNQAVVERLNSLLEPSPSFSVTEDITVKGSDDDVSQQSIPILPSFQIFATVHRESPTAKMNLSPATRSRFTEVHVQPYSTKDLRSIVKNQLKAICPDNANLSTAVQFMFVLRNAVTSVITGRAIQENQDTDVHTLFRMVDFIKNHHPSLDLYKRIWLGIRFFYCDVYHTTFQHELLQACLKSLEEAKDDIPSISNSIAQTQDGKRRMPKQWEDLNHIFEDPKCDHGAIDLSVDDDSNADFSPNYSSILECVDGDVSFVYRMKYTGVCFSASKKVDLDTKMKCAPIPSFVNQVARITAAIGTGCPLLLQGPPGTGKTAVVSQVAKLITGCDVARINFSANTSLDQLLGSVVPRCDENGKRTFEWQDGSIIQAIRENKWLLLDEINLASPEVLDGLARLLLLPRVADGAQIIPLPSGRDLRVPSDRPVRVFATMNPASIGGGRSKLPRAITNLFARVHLEETTDSELRIILDYMFAEQLQQQILTHRQLHSLYELHCEVKGMVKNHDVGRVGGPYDINLRDLSKVRDVLAGNFRDQKYHYMESSNAESNSVERKKVDVNTLSIKKFAELVYTAPFHSLEDQAEVKRRIDKFFPIASGFVVGNGDDIDITVAEGSVRIGSIYLTQGQASSDAPPLKHTPITVRQLEMLAAAAQSKRAVLLEGDTCSRKTALVRELSRITRHKLIVLPMTEATETSDIIGQWLPVTTSEGKSSWSFQILKVIKDTMKLVVRFHADLPSSSASSISQDLRRICNIYGHFDRESHVKEKRIDTDMKLLDELKGTCVRLQRCLKNKGQASDDLKVIIDEINKLVRLASKLKECEQDSSIAFNFVKSDLVHAIENGWWVLLDGVNSAPPEVIERLNSLLEDNPMLSLIEDSGGKVLQQGDGIHPEFRFFATANVYRKNSNKLSSAFLNRMIRIWLPKMDSEIQMLVEGRQGESNLCSQLFKVDTLVNK